MFIVSNRYQYTRWLAAPLRYLLLVLAAAPSPPTHLIPLHAARRLPLHLSPGLVPAARHGQSTTFIHFISAQLKHRARALS